MIPFLMDNMATPERGAQIVEKYQHMFDIEEYLILQHLIENDKFNQDT
jgi:hypothetical protein